MTLRFGYLDEPPPRPGGIVQWRPYVPLRVIGPGGVARPIARALLDTGADDCVFPLTIAQLIGASLPSSSQHIVRWRGQGFPLQFASVELELTDGTSLWRWPALVGFSAAPVRYPILRGSGCLEFLDATFLGEQRIVELDTNGAYPGSKA